MRSVEGRSAAAQRLPQGVEGGGDGERTKGRTRSQTCHDTPALGILLIWFPCSHCIFSLVPRGSECAD